MSMGTKYRTPQEEFWAGSFGNEYIGRNNSQELLASNLSFFLKALSHAGSVSSCVEFGANIGINLRSLKLLHPSIGLSAIEINEIAAKELSDFLCREEIFIGSILHYPVTKQYELALIKGVLIHINPDHLRSVYQKLYEVSNKFILICEYYNPSPVAISYRGNSDRLFKRDFAGEMLDMYPDLCLIDYGFAYHRDLAFPQDDITWFLLRKRT